MMGVKDSENIQYHKCKGTYRVRKKINGKRYYYGGYEDIEKAKELRDALIGAGWPVKENVTKYISRTRNGFHLQKNVNGKNRHYGTFKTLEEAQDVKVALIGAGWPVVNRQRNRYNLPLYLTKDYRSRINPIILHKTINEETTYFGCFPNVEEAVKERDKMIMCSWDYDAVVNYPDVSCDEDSVWLGEPVKNGL